MSTDDLAPFDVSDIHTLLCVVAHPDDMEYGASAAVAKWTAAGMRVHYLLLTSGEAGIRSLDPGKAGPVRRAEQQAACDIVGASSLTFLGFPDGLLETTIAVREAITHAIRRVRPDAILTQAPELRVAWGFNHADHRACGLAVIDAARDADNPWLYRGTGSSAEPEEVEAWRAHTLIVTGSPHPNRYVDVSGEPFEKGVASLSAHEQYLAALDGHPSPRELFDGFTSQVDVPGVERALPIVVQAL